MTDKDDMAESRTDWAEDRTMLANERTFAGWMRTGMGAVAIAVGLRAVFGAVEETWIAQSVATVFLLIALFIFWTAQRQSTVTLRRMSHHDTRVQSRRSMTVTAIGLSVGTVAIGIILWAL